MHAHRHRIIPEDRKLAADRQEGDRDADNADQNAQRDAHGADTQRFKAHHPAKLLLGGAHRGQQAELPGTFGNGDRKGIVDQGDRSEHDEQDQNACHAVHDLIIAAEPRYTQQHQQIGVGIALDAGILHEPVNVPRMLHGIVHVNDPFICIRRRQAGVAGRGEWLKFRAFTDAADREGAGFCIFEMLLPGRIFTGGRHLKIGNALQQDFAALPDALSDLKRDGITDMIHHAAVGRQMLRDHQLVSGIRQRTLNDMHAHQIRKIPADAGNVQVRLVFVGAVDRCIADHLEVGRIRDLLFRAQLPVILHLPSACGGMPFAVLVGHALDQVMAQTGNRGRDRSQKCGRERDADDRDRRAHAVPAEGFECDLMKDIHPRSTSSLVMCPSSIARMRSAWRAMLSSCVMMMRVCPYL